MMRQLSDVEIIHIIRSVLVQKVHLVLIHRDECLGIEEFQDYI